MPKIQRYVCIVDGSGNIISGSGSSSVFVQGAAADGAAPVGNPVYIAGDDGTNIQAIRTDATGRQVVVGAAADGAAVTGNPVLMGGFDGTLAQTVLTDDGGRLNVNVGIGTNAADNATSTTFVGPTSSAGGSRSGWYVLPGVVDASGTIDRVRSSNAAAGTTGDGVLASGPMGFDGTNYQRLTSDTNGTLRTQPLTSNKLALTVQAAAYAAADLVGGKLTFTNVARVSGGSAVIRGILIGDQAANSAANSVYDLIIFDSDPTGTTFTENSPLDIADADLNKIVACVRFDGVAGNTLFTNADNNVIYKPVEIPYTASGTTSLFAALIARGGPTYAAVTDVFITLMLEQK